MTVGTLRRLGQARLGQAMIESALVLPIVFFLIFGIIEGGLVVAGVGSAAYWTNAAVAGVAEAGANAAAGDRAAIGALRQSLLGTSQLFVVDSIEIRPSLPNGQPLYLRGTAGYVDRFAISGAPLPLNPGDVPWSARNASPANADYATVYVNYHYRYRAGILGAQLQLQARATSRLLPGSTPPSSFDPTPPTGVGAAQIGLLRHSNCQGHNSSAPRTGFVYAVLNFDPRGGFFIHVKVRTYAQDNDPNANRLANQHYQVYLYPADEAPGKVSCGPGDPNPVLAGTSADAIVDTDQFGAGDAEILIPGPQVRQYPQIFTTHVVHGVSTPGRFTVELGAPATKRLRFDTLDDEMTSDVVDAP